MTSVKSPYRVMLCDNCAEYYDSEGDYRHECAPLEPVTYTRAWPIAEVRADDAQKDISRSLGKRKAEDRAPIAPKPPEPYEWSASWPQTEPLWWSIGALELGNRAVCYLALEQRRIYA